MTLVLSNDDAAKVLTLANTIDALERLYQDLGKGSAVYRGRTDLFAPTTAEIGADVPAMPPPTHNTSALMISSFIAHTPNCLFPLTPPIVFTLPVT